jgi:hypothetical protein
MFTKGQTVRCATDDRYYINKGQTYVVYEDSSNGYVRITDTDGDIMTYDETDFEAVEPAPQTSAIEAGDSVRVLNSDYPPYIRVGAVLTVDSTIATDEYSRGGLYLKDRDGDALFFFFDEVELVEEEQPAEPRRYQVGDTVRLLRSDWPTEYAVGSLQVVEEVSRANGVSFYKGRDEFYFCNFEVEFVSGVSPKIETGNFELTEDTPVDVAVEIKPQLSITYGGVTINLDPNMTESRMFANAVLELAYA